MPLAVALVAISLTWAGTHLLGRAEMKESFSPVDWFLLVGLLMAGGFLLTTLIIPVDFRQRFDLWTFFTIGGIPLATITYAILTDLGVNVRILDKLLGWAVPYGIAAMGLVLGFAVGAAAEKRAPTPTVTPESLSTLALDD